MKLKILFLLFFVPVWAFSQKKSAEEIQAMISDKNFIVEASQAFGGRGRMIYLDPGYTLVVRPAQVIGNLPFFGRSYTSTPGNTDIGLKFDISEFSYEVKPRKKKGWDVTIETTGSGEDVRSIYLTIQETGNVSMRIISNGKDSMTYNGMIKESTPPN